MTYYIGYIVWPAFIILFLLSATTIVLILPSVFKAKLKSNIERKVELYLKVGGGITALISLLLSIAGITVPLGPLAKDDAKSTIELYFQSIEGGQFDTAYQTLSRARIEEIRQRVSNWGPVYFRNTYATTRRYDNINATLASGNESRRTYIVSYDVMDEIPRNTLYGYRKELLGENALSSLFKEGAIPDLIIRNIKEYYDVQDNVVQQVRDYLRLRRLDSLMDPMFIAEIERNLESDRKISLSRNPSQATREFIKRHFIHEMQMIKEDNVWKIRQGLENPLIAIY
jgi:hypothetical protein